MKGVIKIDSKTIEVLFREYYEELSRYSFSIVKNQDEAEDVVQKLFIKLWEKRAELTEVNNMKSYLYRATYNSSLNVLDHIKRKGVHTQLTTEIVANNSASDQLMSNELADKIMLSIQELPEKCGEVFKLSRDEQLSYKEISEKLNISIKTVENHMGKALKLMRRALSAYLHILITILLLK